MKLTEEIRKVLGSQTTNKSVHSQAIYDVIKDATNEEERLELLKIAFSEYGEVPKHEIVLSNKGIETEEWNELSEKHGQMIKDHARNAYFETNNIEEFTEECFRLIDFFKTENQKAFCLAVFMFSTNIVPYKAIPGDPVRIKTDEFKQLLLAHKEKSELMTYLVRLPFYDWNEAASEVLQVLDSVDNKKLRVALLSLFMMSKIQQLEEK